MSKEREWEKNENENYKRKKWELETNENKNYWRKKMWIKKYWNWGKINAVTE